MLLNLHTIDITNASLVKGIRKSILYKAVLRTLEGECIDNADVSVILVNDDEILELNTKYLHHNYTTDVITFPLDEGKKVEGEIYISVDTAREQAKEYLVTFINELTRLAIHGTLHLVGYDDATKKERLQMHELENKYLEQP